MKFVYIHRRKDNNQIFYIGKGSNSRHKSSNGRSAEWNKVVNNAGGFIAEVVLDFMTESQALDLEIELISYYKEHLVNVQSSSRWKDYSKLDFDKFFKYDENSPSKLSKINGENVGWVNSGYWNITFKGKSYRVHRIIWLLFNKTMSVDKIVNHIDCNPLNNSILNLEVVNHKQNTLRSKRTKGELNTNNTSGHTNIFREKYKRKDGVEIDSVCALVFHESNPPKKLRVRILNGDLEEAIGIAKDWQFSIVNGLDFIMPKRLIKTNKSGHEYICLTKSKKRGKEYFFVLCQPPDKPNKQFSILKYGYDEAISLAIEYRDS